MALASRLLSFIIVVAIPVAAVSPSKAVNRAVTLSKGLLQHAEVLPQAATWQSSQHKDFSRQPGDPQARPQFLSHRQPPNISEHIPWLDKEERTYIGTCGVTHHAVTKKDPVDDDARAWCPDDCPYRAEDTTSIIDGKGFCNFKCVKDWQECKAANPKATVPISDLGACMPCGIGGCARCAADGTRTCEECAVGYYLQGKICVTPYDAVWKVTLGVIVVIIVLILAWLLHLACRKTVNGAALAHGQKFRSLTKLHMPYDPTTQKRNLWPLDTNLCTTVVAGPGLSLHFNFQLAYALWGGLFFIAWCIIAFCVDQELFLHGRRPALTARMYCVLVDFGYKIELMHMYPTVICIFILYVGTSIFTFVLAIRNYIVYQKLDSKDCTYKDYVAICTGLPHEKGELKVEDNLKKRIAKITGKDVVGVSFGWEWGSQATHINDAVREVGRTPTDPIEDEQPVKLPGGILKIESQLMGYSESAGASDENGEIYINRVRSTRGEWKTIKMLQNLKTSACAFVIFNTEQDRDDAIAAVRNAGGILYDENGKESEQPVKGGSTAFLQEEAIEPDAVNWQNFRMMDLGERMKCGLAGVLELLLALLVWTVVFYMPWAYFVLFSDYTQWSEPSPVKGTSAALIITLGNQIMYQVCDDIACRQKCRYGDSKESIYTVVYTFAIVINSVVDLIVTFYMAWYMMSQRGLHTHDGIKLSAIEEGWTAFATYALQREMGNQLWTYNFPATFLIPFLIEPILTIAFPLWLFSRLVETHPEVTQQDAEGFIAGAAFPMDLSRYGDILANVALTAMMVFFPTGYWHRTLLALFASHIYIYLYDHFRVLRVVPRCDFPSKVVDDCSLCMMAFPTGILLVGGIYRSQSTDILDGVPLSGAIESKMVLGFVAHCVVHCIIILFVIPWLYRIPHIKTKRLYTDRAAELPCSFFTANPLWCLRSKYIYGHQDPCPFFSPGRTSKIKKGDTRSEDTLNWYDAPVDADESESYNVGQVFHEGTSFLAQESRKVQQRFPSILKR